MFLRVISWEWNFHSRTNFLRGTWTEFKSEKRTSSVRTKDTLRRLLRREPEPTWQTFFRSHGRKTKCSTEWKRMNLTSHPWAPIFPIPIRILTTSTRGIKDRSKIESKDSDRPFHPQWAGLWESWWRSRHFSHAIPSPQRVYWAPFCYRKTTNEKKMTNRKKENGPVKLVWLDCSPIIPFRKRRFVTFKLPDHSKDSDEVIHEERWKRKWPTIN